MKIIKSQTGGEGIHGKTHEYINPKNIIRIWVEHRTANWQLRVTLEHGQDVVIGTFSRESYAIRALQAVAKFIAGERVSGDMFRVREDQEYIDEEKNRSRSEYYEREGHRIHEMEEELEG